MQCAAAVALPPARPPGGKEAQLHTSGSRQCAASCSRHWLRSGRAQGGLDSSAPAGSNGTGTLDKEVDAISVDMTAFPDTQYFRVEASRSPALSASHPAGASAIS